MRCGRSEGSLDLDHNHGCNPGAAAVILGSSGASGADQLGRDDVGGVAVKGTACAVVPAGLARVGVPGESWTSRRLQPASSAAVIAAWRNEWGEIRLSIPAFPASRRTMRPAACRSSRLPSAGARSAPSVRSPTAASMTGGSRSLRYPHPTPMGGRPDRSGRTRPRQWRHSADSNTDASPGGHALP